MPPTTTCPACRAAIWHANHKPDACTVCRHNPKTEKMKKTLTTHEAANYLLADEYAAWTRAGAFALAEYLDQLGEDIGEEIEFDAVAIRCDYSEHSSLTDWAEGYFGSMESAFDSIRADADDEPEDIEEAIRDHINDHGQLVEFEGGVIVSSF